MAGYGAYVKKLREGLSGAVNVAAGAVSRAAEVAKDLAEDLTSFKALANYKLAGHVASAGPGGVWRVHAAVSKRPGGKIMRTCLDPAGALYPEASVWILDKKMLMDQASRAGRVRGFDAFFELQRRGCAQMSKIKHPGVLKVLEPLEETHGQMVFVSEPLFGSLADMLCRFASVPSAPPERAAAELSPLERRYGLTQLADALTFLHSEARLAHRGLCPSAILITRDGAWRLAGFEHSAPIAEFGSADGGAAAAGATMGAGAVGVPSSMGAGGGGGGWSGGGVYEYSSASPSPWEEYCLPSLPYTAPELVGGASLPGSAPLGGAASGAADVFSLALLAYELLQGQPLLSHVGSSSGAYRSTLPALPSADMSRVPAQLQPLLRGMLSTSAGSRPSAAAFASCPTFGEDVLLRCLRFLDSLLQRDAGQKIAFLGDLSTMWQQFDDRLLAGRVLPPVVGEMRAGGAVALAALPVVLGAMGRMAPAAFAASGILPALKPVFESADGEVLLALVRHLETFYKLLPSDSHGAVLVPLLLRAFESSNTRAQEDALKSLQRLAPELHYALLREQLMPRVVALCLRTTSLVVRTACLALMAQVAHRLDKEAAAGMLDVAGQIVAVDRSAGTAVAVVRLGDAVGRHYAPELTAVRVLPLLCPLLLSPGLSAQQLGSALTVVRGLLDVVADKAGCAAAAADAAGAGGAAARVAALGAAASAAVVPADALTASGSREWEVSGAAPTTPSVGALTPAAATPAAASAAAAASSSRRWDALPPPSGTSMHVAGSTSTSSTELGWGGNVSAPALAWGAVPDAAAARPPPQYHQRPGAAGVTVAAAPRGVASGVPAPDIFSSSSSSSGVGGLTSLAGLSIGAAGGGNSVGAGVSSSLANGAGSGDLFGGLALSSSAVARGTSALPPHRQQQAQQPVANDPFAGLAQAGSAAATGAAGANFDPFSSLAAQPGSSGVSGASDPFASLAGSANAPGMMPLAAQHQQQQQQMRPVQRAPQQQQPAWQGVGGSGSLI